MSVPTEQVVAGHELARNAEAAPDGALLDERRLKPAQPTTVREPLDRLDIPAVRLDGEDKARVDDPIVQPDRTRPALADQAALLRAGQPEVVAQDLEKRVMRFDRHGPREAVENEADVLAHVGQDGVWGYSTSESSLAVRSASRRRPSGRVAHFCVPRPTNGAKRRPRRGLRRTSPRKWPPLVGISHIDAATVSNKTRTT